MKLIQHLKLAVLVFLSLGLLLLPGTLAAQTYEFQYLTGDPGFSPTYLWVTAALNTPVSAAASVLDYQINTRLGTWTPVDFQSKNSGEKSKAPFWSSGTVELLNDGHSLDFLSTAELEAVPSGLGFGDDHVQLTTTSVSSDAGIVPGSTGIWSLVSISTVPDGANTLTLLLAVAIGLGAYRHFAGTRTEPGE